MPIEPVPLDTTPEALARLSDFGRDLEARTLEDSLQAHAFMQQCAKELDENERIDRYEHRAVEVLEVVATGTAGALSTWKSGPVPLGVVANWTLGGAAKVGSFINPKNRALRIACRTGKTLLHSQIAIHTRNKILETP